MADNNDQQNDKNTKKPSYLKRAFRSTGKTLTYATMYYKAASVPEKVALQIGIHSVFFIPLNNAVGFALLYDDYKTYKENKNKPKETPPPFCTEHHHGELLVPLPCCHVLHMDSTPKPPKDYITQHPKND